MGAPEDSAAIARAKSHMNANHARELSHYLRHFCGLSARAAADPELTDLSLSGMAIRSRSGREHRVPFDPPLASPAEIRPRVVAMDADARRGLGIADVYVTEYVAPAGFEALVAAGVALYFVCYFTLPLVVPRTVVWDLLEGWFPGGAGGYRWLTSTIFWPVVVIHSAEGWWFHRTRMLPHGVETGSALWWKWLASNWFEGLCAFMRVDRIVAEKRRVKQAKDH